MKNFFVYGNHQEKDYHWQTEYDNLHDLLNMGIKIKTNPHDKIILVILLCTETFADRHSSFADLIKLRYNLICDPIIEKQYKNNNKLIRVGAVSICNEQTYQLLTLLHHKTFSSFCIIAHNEVSKAFTESLLEKLTANNFFYQIKDCCSISLKNNASFIHILHGCDGYSFNRFICCQSENKTRDGK